MARVLLCATLITSLFAAATAEAQESITKTHALSLVGEPRYAQDFEHLDYANPNAPKGGELRLSAIGGFDTFNQFIIKGDAAAGIGLMVETLMTSPNDDVSAEYGLIAESIEVPEDLSWVIFNLRPAARFHDGTPITADDVIFSFNVLKEKGRPFYRFYYSNVEGAERLGERRVKFIFSGPRNRELPQIMGQLPILSKAYWQTREFDQTTLKPFVASGPYRIRDFEPNRWVAFERVEDYWGADLPINRGRYNFDVVRFEYFRDTTIALEAFKAGTYDFRQENSAKEWAKAYDFPAARQKLVILDKVPHQRPTGMQSFAYNLRRPVFQNRTLRRALAYAFDFEWSNENLFFGQYERTESYFSNSELAATDLPSQEELRLLEPLRDELPPEVFTTVYRAPSTADGGGLRGNLRTASRLLGEAGYKVKDRRLIDPATGQPVTFEILLVSPNFERVTLPFTKNLQRLGVTATVRTVDSAQYVNRLRSFDYDMIVANWGQSLSPGNEQRDFWGSEAAERAGSRNYAGIADPAIDKLIDHVIFAEDRPALVTATRALDRALLWGHYVVPQWHLRFDRVAYWNKFGRPAKPPAFGIDLFAWWVDGAKAAEIAGRTGATD